MHEILTPVLWLAAAGLLCGLALALAARFFAVREDPRVEKLLALLPGANCGGCGYAGCAGYAAAIAAGDAPVGKCTAGADSAALAAVMGQRSFETDAEPPKAAIVLCGGTESFAKRAFLYDGLVDCAAANAVAGGDKACKYGCLGYGSCVRVCPVNAIEIAGGVARVHRDRCIGCGKCAEVCPRHVIELVPRASKVHVFCKSPEPGAKIRKYCSAGCIGCRICTRKAPGAMEVDGNLAHVKYDVPFPVCDAVADCPVKCLREELP